METPKNRSFALIARKRTLKDFTTAAKCLSSNVNSIFSELSLLFGISHMSLTISTAGCKTVILPSVLCNYLLTEVKESTLSYSLMHPMPMLETDRKWVLIKFRLNE